MKNKDQDKLSRNLKTALDVKADNNIKPQKTSEKGGPKGPEPTRYGDWEKGGKCVDF